MAAPSTYFRLSALPQHLQCRIFSFLIPSTLIGGWTPTEAPRVERGGRKGAFKNYLALLLVDRTTHHLVRRFFNGTVTISFMVMPSLEQPPLLFPWLAPGTPTIIPESAVAGLRAIEVCRIFNFSADRWVGRRGPSRNVLVTARIAKDKVGNPQELGLKMEGIPGHVGMMFERVLQQVFIEGEYGFRKRVEDVVVGFPWYGGEEMTVAEMSLEMACCFVELIEGDEIF